MWGRCGWRAVACVFDTVSRRYMFRLRCRLRTRAATLEWDMQSTYELTYTGGGI